MRTQKGKRFYRPVPRLSARQVSEAVANGDLGVLRQAAFAVPWHAKDAKAAQAFCLHLSNYADAVVRGNALLGLSYLARFKKPLDRKMAALALRRGLKDRNRFVRERAEDALTDINRLR